MAPLVPHDQSPSGRSSSLLLLKLAVVIGYLDLVFYVMPRDFLEYKFAQFLFDYAHGLSRRSLEGEIFRHLVRPPYTSDLFAHVAGLQTVAVIILFGLIVWQVEKRSRFHSRFIMALLLISSPTTFKNLIFDFGRQDCIGVMALEVSILLGLIGSAYPLSLFLCAVMLPVALINENLLLLYMPACLAVHGCRLWAERRNPRVGGLPLLLKVGPFLMLAASYLICLGLPYPAISLSGYHEYLKSKSVQSLGHSEPERWLYSNASDNFAFARGEWAKFSPLQFASAGQYVAFLLVLVLVCCLVAFSAGRDSPRSRRLFWAALACLLPGYIVLFVGASDLARWFSNLNLAIMLFGYWYLSWSESEPSPRVWMLMVPIAGVQLLLMGGFGIVYPNFTFAGDLARMAALF